jgi:hypothetical protein
MRENRNAFNILVSEPEGKRLLGRPRHSLEDTTEIEWENVEWINVTEWRSVAGLCEHNNDPSGFIKYKKSLN